MRHLKIAVFLVSIAALAIAPACGGGNRGFRVPSNPLDLATNVFPTLLSGQALEYALPITGGCNEAGGGGPYILNLIDGELPEGITLDDREADIDGPGVPSQNRRHIVGIALEDGIFTGTIEVIDTSCDPFASLSFDFNWNIGRGPVQIVAANPALIPVADYVLQDPSAFPDADAIPSVIFNQFGSILLIAAGGVPPYDCDIIDDPLDPDDGPLPLGTSMPPNSCSIVGSPVQVGPNGQPFRLTVRVTDSINNTSTKKFQWKVRTPPIIIGTQVVADGIAGTAYADVFQVADGVPPFRHAFTASVPSPNDNTDPSWMFSGGTTAPTIPGVTVSNTGPAIDRLDAGNYPLDTTVGPYVNGPPPEGLTLSNQGSETGTLQGVPRRMGTFTVNLHTYSELVPNESGQHAWTPFTFNIADSEAAPITPFAVDPSFTVQQVLNTGVGDTFPDLPEFSANSVYNPDSTSHTPTGLQMLGEGGVPYDGKIDSPNTHTAAGAPINLTNSNEVDGNYEWTVVDWNPLGGNDPIPTIRLFGAPGGAENIATSDGVINTDNPAGLQRQSRQVVRLEMHDQQLPESTHHHFEQNFGLSVGPDVVIITESTSSMNATTRTTHTQIDQHDDQLYIRKLEIIAGTPVISDLSSALDMAATHTIPPDATGLPVANPLGGLLSRTGQPAAPALPAIDPHSIDLLRGVINPSLANHDVHGLNPQGGRAMQGTGENGGHGWIGDNEDSYPGYQPTAAAVELPDTDTHNPSAGVYGDGGYMYPFESSNYFGVFIVREDGKIYVPYAASKSGAHTGFGDGIVQDRGPDRSDVSRSTIRTVQLTISPNGKFCAMKLKSNHLDLDEPTSLSDIVIFALDGAKPFAGATHRVTTCGYTAGMPSATSMYSTSMVLTDRHLYFLNGEDNDSTTTASWQDHYIMECPILAGAPVAATGFGPNWTQNPATGTAMQTPFQHFSSPTSNQTTFTFTPTFTSVLVTVTNNDRYSYDGMNMIENSVAPIPFRVSEDGTTCCVLAGQTTTSTSNSSAIWKFHAWANRLGAGFTPATTVARTARAGASMPHVLRRGANSYRHWGNYEGPSGGFEVNRTGTKLAFTYSERGTIGSTTSPTSHNLGLERQNLRAYETGDLWATGTDDGVNQVTEHTVTGDKFVGSHKWKFGSLAFGKDDKLYFWGGASTKGTSTSDSTTTGTTAAYHQWAATQTGTFYSYDFNSVSVSRPTGEVKSLFATNEGGTGVNTYHATSTFSPSTSAPAYPVLGDIVPVGGFKSLNGDFLYILCQGGLGAGSASLAPTQLRLAGLNLTAGTINGHTAGEGFLVDNWPARRGFLPEYYYQHHYAISGRFYVPGKSTMSGRVKMAKDSGYVFFASHNQWRRATKTNSNTSTFSKNSEMSYWDGRGAYDGHIEGFHADVGGRIERITQPGLSDPTPGNPNSDLTRSNRGIIYLEVSRKGDRLAYQAQTGGTTNRFDLELIGYADKIAFNPANGNLIGNHDAFLLEGNSTGETGVLNNGQGRAAPSMAFDSSGRKLYYAFRTTGNENLKQLVEATIDPGDPTQSTDIRIGPTRRYNVLKAGR